MTRRQIAALAAVGPLLAAAVFGLVSADVPLALAWGRAIAAHGGPPATNVLSAVHGDYPVQLDKWAFQLAAFRTYSLGGPAALVVVRVALLNACLFGLVRAARVRWRSGPEALVVTVAALAIWHRPYLRAELVTWAALPWTMALVPHLARGRRAAFGVLFALQAVWANCHGYWVLGPLVLAAHGAGRLFHGDRPGAGRVAGGTALAVAAACATPYGWRTLLHPWRLAFELESGAPLESALADFVRPWATPWTLFILAAFVCAAAVIPAAVVVARAGRLRAGDALAAVGGLVLGLAWARNLPIAAILAAPVLVAAARCLAGRTGRVRPWCWSPWPGVLALVGLWSGAGFVTDFGRRFPGLAWRDGAYPVAAADRLATELPADAPLWNDLTSGGWLAWRLGPGRTSIDGNTDGYPMAFLQEYRHQLSGRRPVIDPAKPDTSRWYFARPEHPAHRLVLATLASDPFIRIRFWDSHGAVLAGGPGAPPADRPAEDRGRADCRRWSREWARANPRDVERVRQLAVVIAGNTEARQAAAQLAAVLPYVAELRILAARAALADEDHAAAFTHACAATWLRPDAWESWAVRGDVGAASDAGPADLADARRCYERAMRLAPSAPTRLELRSKLSALPQPVPSGGAATRE